MNGPPAGPPGPTPPGPHQPVIVRKQKPKANPLRPMQRPKKLAPRPPPGVAPNALQPSGQPASAPSPQARPARSTFVEEKRSPSPEGEPQIFKVYMTKKDLVDGLRFHVARLKSHKAVDITDEKEYTRPIRLYRRDRGDFSNGADSMDVDSKEDLIDEKEREKAEAIKAERQRIREENAKLIAPTVNAKRRPQAFKKKTEQVYRAYDTPEEQKRSQLRYEEALPWHLEDFDNKHIWEGAYQDTFGGKHVLLMPAEDGAYKLIPVEKRYIFTERRVGPQMAAQNTEMKAEKKLPQHRWVTEAQKQREQKKRQDLEEQRARGFFSRKGGNDEQRPSGSDAFDQPEEALDADDIDFNYQEDFADDEENDLFEGDEETTKEAEKRIQREQLGANIFNQNDEKEVEEEEERERKLRELEKRAGKKTKKLLRKKGGDWTLYESDSDRGPGGIYESPSEESDSEAEARKREEEAKEQEKGKGKEREGGKPGSGASSRGTNTPSGRGKTVDMLRANTTQPPGSLKRRGSPNVSDASGNESSRKKAKKTHGSGTATPRAMSPTDGERSRQASLAPGVPVRKPSAFGAGSGSDTDGTGSGIRIKLNMGKAGGSRGGTPSGSRAGSPAAPTAAAPAMAPPLPTAREILEKIPSGGILLPDLTKMFRARRFSPSTIKEFATLVRSITDYDKATKLLRPKAGLNL